MLDFFKRLFGFSAKPVEAAPSAPYKVPEPAATTPIPLVVTNSKPADNVPVAKKAPAKAKAPAKPKAAATKAKAPAKPKAAATKAKAPAKPKMKVVK